MMIHNIFPMLNIVDVIVSNEHVHHRLISSSAHTNTIGCNVFQSMELYVRQCDGRAQASRHIHD